jgi:phosphatidylglycerol---prolipoprotein diacylglyceryl transferase
MSYLNYPDWIRPEIIPGLPFRWYGFMYLVAFAITYLLVSRQLRERKVNYDADEVTSYFFWTIIGVLVCARIFATIVYDTSGRYLRAPWLVFWPFDETGAFTGLQGMSYHGGFLGAIVATVVFCRVKRISFLDWGDTVAAAVPLGYTFGRLGNFINGELYGRVTSSPLGMIFPEAERFPASDPWVKNIAGKIGMSIPDPAGLLNLPRHPSQLYEAFFEGLVLWAFLWFFIRKRKSYDGFVMGWYMIGYGIVRFFIEYFREPDAGIGYRISLAHGDAPTYLFSSPWNFSTGQILCFLMIIGGILFLAIARGWSRRHPGRSSASGTGTAIFRETGTREKSGRNSARRTRKKIR